MLTKFPKKISSVFACGLLVSTIPFTYSCTDEEVATGAAVVAVGAAVVAIGVGGPVVSSCTDTTYRECHTYRDYYGREISECRMVVDYCDDNRDHHGHDGHHGGGHHDGRHFASTTARLFATDYNGSAAVLSETPVSELVTTQRWASAFSMSDAAAQEMIDSLDKAKSGDLSAITDLGLSREDSQKLAQLQMPSNQGISGLAKHLNQSPTSTRAMIYKMIAHGYQVKKVECAKPAETRAVIASVCG